MRQPRRSFYILLPLLATLFASLAAELAVALFYPVPFSLERNMYFEPDPYTGFRHRPNTQGQYLNGIPAIANSRGQRDAEIEIPKLPGVFRILVVGDSFTVGASVEQHEAFPQVLGQILKGTGSATVEVVNAGVGGWAPFQYAQFLEYYGDAFEPDLVVTGLFVGNDIFVDVFGVEDTLTTIRGRRVSRETQQSPWGETQVWLYERSHIARLLMKQSVEPLKFLREHCGEFNPYFLAVQRNRIRNHIAVPTSGELELLEGNIAQLERIERWSAARGIPHIVFIFPDENQVNPLLQEALLMPEERQAYDFASPQTLLQSRMDERGIIWSDLLEVLRADPRCLFMNDSHWTPEGHALVAAQIKEELLRRRLLPE